MFVVWKLEVNFKCWAEKGSTLLKNKRGHTKVKLSDCIERYLMKVRTQKSNEKPFLRLTISLAISFIISYLCHTKVFVKHFFICYVGRVREGKR